jgi:hypothetical protein
MESEINGFWWEAGEVERKVPGTLLIRTGQHVDLEVHGQIGDIMGISLPSVFGQSHGGEKISLLHCGVIDSSAGRLRNATKVRATTAVLGGHFASEDEIHSDTAYVSLSNLREWTGKSFQKVQINWQSGAVKVEQNPSSTVELGSWKGVKFDLLFSHQTRPTWGDIRLTETCSARLTADRQLSLVEWDDIILRLQHFVAFGYGEGVYPLELSLKCNEALNEGNSERRWKVFRHYEQDGNRQEGERTTKHNCLFTMSALGLSPGSFLSEWLSKGQRLRPMTDSYLSIVYSNTIFPVQTFLSLAAALEGYHRAFIPGKFMEDAQYQTEVVGPLVGAMPPSLEKGFRTSLKNRLKYLNEYSLQKRLKDICRMLGATVSALLPKPSEFAAIAKNFRNGLTHFGNEQEFQYDEVHLVQLIESFRLLVELCVLKEIGFSDAMLLEATQRNPHAESLRWRPFKDPATDRLHVMWERYLDRE